MKLEEAIKHHFSDEVEKLVVNIAYTQSTIQSAFSEALKPFKISIQQYNTLRILKGQHPNSVKVNDISNRMVDKMSNASRLVDKLEAKNWVLKKHCDIDRRQVKVSLTTIGIVKLKEISSVIEEVMIKYEHISSKDAALVNCILERLRNGENR